MKRVELLAPAKDLYTAKVAIEAGANAVYLGGKSFGARFFATNLENEDLKEAVLFAHTRGAKVYVTVNTIVYQSEWNQLIEYLDYLSKIDVDAIIVQDLGVLYYVRSKYPHMEVHASTQMNIYNERGLEILNHLGVKRVVLARETSLEMIKKLKNQEIELEVFVHGALCFCASGNCLMSYAIGNRSGNRGKCAQPCRKTYTLYENQTKISVTAALMSMKDLCTIQEIDKLIEAGITSFKIEGRMKSAEYVYTTVKAYKKAIDAYYDKIPMMHIDDEVLKMKMVFNRQFTKGYLLNEKNSLFTNIDHVNHQGIVIGKIIRCDSKKIEIKLSSDLTKQDALRINTPSGIGFYVQKMFVDGVERTNARANEIVKIPIGVKNALGKEVLKTKSADLSVEVKKFMLKEHIKIPLYGKFYLKIGQQAKLIVTDNKNTVEVVTDSVLNHYSNHPQNDIFYINSLNKLGDTPFYFANISIDTDQKAFISLKELNHLRKKAIHDLIEKRNSKGVAQYHPFIVEQNKYFKFAPTFEAIVHTEEQYQICKKYGIQTIYTDYPSSMMTVSRFLLKNQRNHMIHNVGHIEKNNVASPYFNIVNKQAIECIKNLGISKIYLSYELDLTQIKLLDLNKVEANIGIPIYGKMDMMVFKHCMIAKAKGYIKKSCQQCWNNMYDLEDEYHNKFRLFPNPTDDCTLRLINDKPIDLINQIDLFKKEGINLYLLTFTTENCDETEKILKRLKLKRDS